MTEWVMNVSFYFYIPHGEAPCEEVVGDSFLTAAYDSRRPYLSSSQGPWPDLIFSDRATGFLLPLPQNVPSLKATHS